MEESAGAPRSKPVTCLLFLPYQLVGREEQTLAPSSLPQFPLLPLSKAEAVLPWEAVGLPSSSECPSPQILQGMT